MGLFDFLSDAGEDKVTETVDVPPARIGNTNGLLRVDMLADCVDWTC